MIKSPRLVPALLLTIILFHLHPAAAQTLGEHDAIPITVTTASGAPVCRSFSFSQIPGSPELFVGKFIPSSAQSLCADGGKHSTLALFRLTWTTHVMTVVQPLLQIPFEISAQQ